MSEGVEIYGSIEELEESINSGKEARAYEVRVRGRAQSLIALTYEGTYNPGPADPAPLEEVQDIDIGDIW